MTLRVTSEGWTPALERKQLSCSAAGLGKGFLVLGVISHSGHAVVQTCACLESNAKILCGPDTVSLAQSKLALSLRND